MSKAGYTKMNKRECPHAGTARCVEGDTDLRVDHVHIMHTGLHAPGTRTAP